VVHPDNVPHNHPIPRIAKASFEARKPIYSVLKRQAIMAHFFTVQKVDQGEIDPLVVLIAAGVNRILQPY
jgi:hypothetical protein